MSTPSILDGLTVRQLHSALAILKGGAIGFDPYRNPETNSKEKVIQYMLNHFSTDSIVDALQTVKASTINETATNEVQVSSQLAQEAYKKSEALAQALADLIAINKAPVTAAIDEEKVNALIEERLKTFSAPVRVEIKTAQNEIKDCGIQHYKFPQLLKSCAAVTPEGYRLNVWLKGPAGSGKTTAAKEVAKALGMDFYSNGAIDTKFELTGFINAAGVYIPSIFRKAWENGGVYLFDEVDASNPQAVTCFNAALANGFFAFPDGMIPRHKDLVVIAGANTSGNGATSEYVGRMKQDAAFLNRFVEIQWDIDETLERSLCADIQWVTRVQEVRRRVLERGIKGHLITPRATIYGASLLAQGLDRETVEAMVLKKGLSDDAWSQIA